MVTESPTTKECRDLFSPDRYVTGVVRIDPQGLVSSGIRGVLLDIDNTLVPRDRTEAPPGVLDWVASLKSAGLGVCFVSNNWHDVIFDHARALGGDLVAKAMKPFPFAFLAGARRLGLRARECVVIGDQVFTDVLGGNLVGASTILVRPQSVSDLPHTLLLRRLERIIMRDRSPES